MSGKWSYDGVAMAVLAIKKHENPWRFPAPPQNASEFQ